MVGAIAPTIGAVSNIARPAGLGQGTEQQRAEQQRNAQEPRSSEEVAGANPIAQPETSRRVQPVENANNAQPSTNEPTSAPASSDPTGQQLTREEQEQLRDLQQRDQEVRAHEQAHATVGGPYAGAPQYETVRGPDGQQYAVSGEVQIDASPENDPEDTVRKMEVVIRAALAPAQPSPQDQRVAQQARQQLIQAQAEVREQNAAESGQEGQGGERAQNQPPIEQALARFREAEETERLGRERPVATNSPSNNDSVDFSPEAQEIISALQSVA